MGLPEVLLVIYLPLWLLAVADATIAKFDRWYLQFGWLLAMFPGAGRPRRLPVLRVPPGRTRRVWLFTAGTQGADVMQQDAHRS